MKHWTPDALRAWRLARGWTQQEAGEWYGLAPAHAKRSWRRYECGERAIPSTLVAALQHHATARYAARLLRRPPTIP
jgi:transcriptional regulator with XRE-family HTH domain